MEQQGATEPEKQQFVTEPHDQHATGQVSVHSLLTSEVELCLAADDDQRLRRCIDAASDTDLAAEAWDIARCLAMYLTQENLENHPVLFVLCSTVIRDRVSLIGSAKEVLLVLMEALDCFKDDCRFEHLIPSVRNCLKRTGAASAEAALEVLGAHIESCDDPPSGLEEDELALMQSNPKTQRCLRLTGQLVDLLVDLLQDAGSNPAPRLQRAVATCALQLLEKPLMSADLCWKGRSKKMRSDACDVVCQIAKLLAQLKEYSVTDVILDGISGDLTANRDARLALAYVIVTGAVDVGLAFPQVYSGPYLMRRLLPVLTEVLSSSAQFPMQSRAGLHILHQFLSGPDEMESGLWDLAEFVQFWTSLQFALIHHPASDGRALALKCIEAAFAASGPEGRYRAILRSLHSSDHASCRGFFITKLKNEIAKTLDACEKGHGDCGSQITVFTGSSVQRLLSKTFSLPKGAISDMLEEGEVLLAGLNLAKFLGIRDKQNVTLFWNKYQNIVDGYLDEIRTGFNMSMAHYKAEYRNPTTEEDLIVSPEEMRADGVDPTISVGGIPLPPLTRGEKRRVMREALTRLELLVFVHGDTCDCLERLRPQWVAAPARPSGDADNPYVKDATEVTHIPDDKWDPSDLTV